jgi:diaminopimelate epimerase
MRFTKMHGAGNDYIYVDCFHGIFSGRPSDIARRISDRHTGVGADGLVLIRPAEGAHARMEMYNADGSRSEMCGNALRCVAKYIYERGYTRDQLLRIETDSGLLTVTVYPEGRIVRRARALVGKPMLERERIPMAGAPGSVIDEPIEAAGKTFNVTALSVGNPHAVIFVDDFAGFAVAKFGPAFEQHAVFPKRTNVHFVKVIEPNAVESRTWERGSGETLACGTGAAAICVAGSLTGRTERQIHCRALGGVLEVEWASDESLFVTGPVEQVFTGEWTG